MRGVRLGKPNSDHMAGTAVFGLLYDTIDRVESFIRVFVYVYSVVILAYIITSLIRLPYSRWLSRFQRFLYDVCEPYLRLFRRILPTFGPLDLSPMIGVACLYVFLFVVDSILNLFH